VTLIDDSILFFAVVTMGEHPIFGDDYVESTFANMLDEMERE
jgi:hypothetical protein